MELQGLYTVFWMTLCYTTVDAECGDPDLSENLSFAQLCQSLEVQLRCQADLIQDPLQATALYESGRLGYAQLADYYGCSFGSMYQADGNECNVKRLLQCYNPMLFAIKNLEHRDLPLEPVTQHTSLANFTNTISEIYSASENLISLLPARPRLCSEVDVKTIDKINKCFTAETIKCYDGLHRGVRSGTTELTRVISSMETAGAIFGGFCDAGCNDITTRALNLYVFGNCETLYDVLPAVAADYNIQRDTAFTCRNVNSVIKCTNDDAMGCPPLESTHLAALASPNMYQMYSECDVTENINFNPDLRSCTEANIRFILFQSQTCSTLGSFDTDEELCGALRMQQHCITSHIKCCEVKHRVLTPMLHNWAMFNQLLNCGITLGPADGAVRIRPQGDTCNYGDVLRCLGDVFSAFDFELQTEGQVHALDIRTLNTQIETMKQNQTSFCSATDNLDYNKIKQCIRKAYLRCELLPTCDDEPYAHQPIPATTVIVDLDQLQSFTSICHDDCDVAHYRATVLQCEESYKTFDFYLSILKLQTVTKSDTASTCSAIRSLSDCYATAIGQCEYMAHEVQEHLMLASCSVRRLTRLCNVDFAGIGEQASRDCNKNNDLVDGANTHKAHIITICCILALTWFSILYNKLT